MTYTEGFSPAQAVTMFCQAAAQKGLIDWEDKDYTVNRVLEIMALDAPGEAASLLPMLRLCDMLVDHAVQSGLCEDTADARDRFSARLYGAVTPGPRAVRQGFYKRLQEEGPQAACDAFYRMCRDNDYIRTRRIARNIRYTAPTPAGDMHIAINLSRPEKDPRDIAAQRLAPEMAYPKCLLCPQNAGYAGRAGYPARQNLRIIPLTLKAERWYLQYSPYLYYEEHCIVLKDEHRPMNMTADTFEAMFDFVDLIPHYFIGSNADLPILGSSILTHDHFQGGRYVFPMESALPLFSISTGDAGVSAGALRWPMTCLRFESPSRAALSALMVRVLDAWRLHSDPDLHILHETYDLHNAITPIIRRQEGRYVVYLLLRNNRATPEHPLGLFHAHAPRHHIKKENIGLIEAMGLFILPGRLKDELQGVCDYLLHQKPLPRQSPHLAWAKDLLSRMPRGLSPAEAERFVRHQVAHVCHDVLCDTGVFKQDEEGEAGLKRFLKSVGMEG